jgi:hypothetical protein
VADDPGSEVLVLTLDPDGRLVGLTKDRWDHIKAEHAILAPRMREVVAAVRDPVFRTPGREPDEEWFYSDEALRHRLVRVVVHYEGGQGWIWTAFPVAPVRGR